MEVPVGNVARERPLSDLLSLILPSPLCTDDDFVALLLKPSPHRQAVP